MIYSNSCSNNKKLQITALYKYFATKASRTETYKHEDISNNSLIEVDNDGNKEVFLKGENILSLNKVKESDVKSFEFDYCVWKYRISLQDDDFKYELVYLNEDDVRDCKPKRYTIGKNIINNSQVEVILS